jgi:hypothetical protein
MCQCWSIGYVEGVGKIKLNQVVGINQAIVVLIITIVVIVIIVTFVIVIIIDIIVVSIIITARYKWK